MIKRFALLSLTALLTAAAHAAPVLLDVTTNSITGSKSAGLSTVAGSNQVTHTTQGYFKDEFLFTHAGLAKVNAFLNTSYDNDIQKIVFKSASFMNVDGSSLAFVTEFDEDTGTTDTFGFSPVSFTAQGSFLMIIEGWAGGNNGVFGTSPISASYSGGINVTPLANNVPEPSALLLVAIGAAAAAAAMRRKRS